MQYSPSLALELGPGRLIRVPDHAKAKGDALDKAVPHPEAVGDGEDHRDGPTHVQERGIVAIQAPEGPEDVPYEESGPQHESDRPVAGADDGLQVLDEKAILACDSNSLELMIHFFHFLPTTTNPYPLRVTTDYIFDNMYRQP